MDREKVIRAFEQYVYNFVKLTTTDEYNHQILEQVLVLLKEQEAVKPKSKVRHGANAQIQHFCVKCNAMLHGKPKFCSECGQKVKW